MTTSPWQLKTDGLCSPMAWQLLLLSMLIYPQVTGIPPLHTVFVLSSFSSWEFHLQNHPSVIFFFSCPFHSLGEKQQPNSYTFNGFNVKPDDFNIFFPQQKLKAQYNARACLKWKCKKINAGTEERCGQGVLIIRRGINEIGEWFIWMVNGFHQWIKSGTTEATRNFHDLLFLPDVSVLSWLPEFLSFRSASNRAKSASNFLICLSTWTYQEKKKVNLTKD